MNSARLLCSPYRTVRHFAIRSHVFAMLMIALPLFQGCEASTSPNLSPEATAVALIESYDANKDGRLDEQELKKCPPLASIVKTIDADGDGGISAQEIAPRLGALLNGSLTEVTCTVMLSGRALAGAQVRLQPLKAFGDAIPDATGITDEAGVTRPSIPADQLDEEFREYRLVYPGLYTVEITHPQQQLPSRYNDETELGLLIDTTSRDGAGGRFDLKAN
jgi:hypothetical protein